MKKKRNYKKVILSSKGEKKLLTGHPWVFEGEILHIESPIDNGSLVDVVSEKGKYLGTGFYNDHSKIRVRILSRNTNDTFDQDFWKRRIKYAWEYRKTVMPDTSSIRIIFGEADFFPGLTVDKFENILVTQTFSLGIEQRKDIIFPLLCEVLKEDGILIEGIYERNDGSLREKEGMEENKQWYFCHRKDPSNTFVTIKENDLLYQVDFANGQKTGYFLDQKINRLYVKNISKNKIVLDCCTHTGSFAMNAAMGNAKKVHALDISNQALQIAEKNINLNHLESVIETKQADLFEYLTELKNKKIHPYDIIILDPPAFTKAKNSLKNAYKGYYEINYLAMKILKRGGYLVTASCSHFMSEKLFKEMLHRAAKDANISLREIVESKQSPDHPILWNVEETNYLKFFIFQIV